MDDHGVNRHPLPQDVSGYEFRLVGNMTLKQFGELALGIILAFICWSLPIVSFFKYLLVGFFALLGFGLAFMPINERPLDKWIINFFRSVYLPTQYLWQKTSVTPDFLEKQVLPLSQPEPKKETPAVDRERLKEYLQSLPQPTLQPQEESIDLSLEEVPTSPPPRPNPPADRNQPLAEPPVVVAPKVPEPPVQTKTPVQTTTDINLPPKPAIPNVLVGMVLDDQGKILADTMLEIRDEKSFPVRAFKANKLGQFSIATPLKDGLYELEAEKTGYQFDLIRLQTKGSIIDPLKIQAKEIGKALDKK